ncbi:MAG: hypothetical protein MK085_05770, partial [Phycisphaerales bacterium]|nr:hypothetical protein [Phycisphaerales bacterium]
MIGRVLVALGLLGLFGCTPEVTEYHRRPGFYRLASEGDLPDQFVDGSGRTVKFIEDGPLPGEKILQDEEQQRREEKIRERREAEWKAAVARGENPPPLDQAPKMFKSREVLDDGTVVLRAIFPDHVIGNTMVCLRNQEYQLLWDQGLAESTKSEYEARGMGADDFIAFCRKNRSELMTTLNRMSFGYYGGSDVLIDKFEDGSIRIRFNSQLGRQFTFREVFVVL